MAQHLIKCAEFNMPLDTIDIKMFVQTYLMQRKRTVAKFKNNVPGDDWVLSFLGKHTQLSLRMCQNIKCARAEVKPETIQQYFDNLEKSLKDVPAENILNYDETNLSDDPVVKKCMFLRGVKYPERAINYSKGNISLMFAGTAAGELLPPYVIYKGECLWSMWCEAGPEGAQYGRSKNGWMDSSNFDEWFLTIVVPWARKKEGKKVMIGDNLSSHQSSNVLEQCDNYGISFILLPPNSTDKLQPLDVAFFGPQERQWRKIVEEYRKQNPSQSSVQKTRFPRLLNKLVGNMEMKNRANLIAGFEACGIHPFNPQRVLRKFPQVRSSTASGGNETRSPFKISAALLEFLQPFKYSPRDESKPGPRHKLAIEPGKSVSAKDLNKESVLSRPSTSKALKATKSAEIVTNTAQPTKSAVSVTKSAVSVAKSTSHETAFSESTQQGEIDMDKEDVGDVTEGCFIVVKLSCVGGKSAKYYVAKVVEACEGEEDGEESYEVNFLRQSAKVLGKCVPRRRRRIRG